MKKDSIYTLCLLQGKAKKSVSEDYLCAKNFLINKESGGFLDFYLPQRKTFLIIPEADLNDSRKIRTWAKRFVDRACAELSLDAISLPKWQIEDMEWNNKEAISAFVQSALISLYSYDKYKSKKKPKISIDAIKSQDYSLEDFSACKQLVEEIDWVKDLVETPAMDLSAQDFAKQIEKHVKKLVSQDLIVKLWSAKEMEAAGFGGILGVNKGSIEAPAFAEIVYKPSGAKNKQPIVLLGKGVVFDAGGMNIKTGSYMDEMKTDMSGGALASGIMAAVVKFKLPIYLVALVPATDNRLNNKALVPGDVIRIGGNTTVEIVNTDAEGRLLLADAAAYAQKQYDPSLIISMATLTGAASRALGTKAIVAMQERMPNEMLAKLDEASVQTDERFWFFPMWKEYERELDSKIADIKNCGSASAGMISAAKFVSYFVKSPFLHLDIAGVSYLNKDEDFLKTGATAMGLRLVYSFLSKISSK